MAKAKAASVPAKKPVSPRAAAALAEARQAEIKKRLDAVGPDLYFAYEEIMESELNLARSAIFAIYKLGQRCNQVHTKYKHNGLQTLAWALNKTKEQIEEACRLANRYTDKEIQDFLALRTPNGEPLTKSHLLELSSVDDREQRKQLSLRAAAEDMTYRELSLAVQAHYGAPRSSGGRGFAQPASLPGLLTSWTKRSEVLLGFHDQVVDKSFEQLVNDTPPDKLSEEVLGQIDEAASAIIKLREAAEADLDRLTALKARVQDVIVKRPAAPETNGAQPAPMSGPVKTLRPKTVGTPKAAPVKKQKLPGKINKRVAPAKVKVAVKSGKKR